MLLTGAASCVRPWFLCVMSKGRTVVGRRAHDSKRYGWRQDGYIVYMAVATTPDPQSYGRALRYVVFAIIIIIAK